MGLFDLKSKVRRLVLQGKAEKLAELCQERETSQKYYYNLLSNKWHSSPSENRESILKEISDLACEHNWKICVATGYTVANMVRYDPELADFAFNIIIKLLRNRESFVRSYATIAFMEIANDYFKNASPVIPKLIELLNDTDDYVVVCVTDALGEVGEKHSEDVESAIPKLKDIFKNDLFKHIRVNIAITLGRLGIEDVLEPLQEMHNEYNMEPINRKKRMKKDTMFFRGEKRPMLECIDEALISINKARLCREKEQIIAIIDNFLEDKEK